MVTYDPDVIQDFADSLYARARGMIAVYTVAGLIVTGIVAALVAEYMGTDVPGALPWIAALMGGVLGYRLGQAKAFEFKLKAQRALTQIQIVDNTAALKKRLRTIDPGARGNLGGK